MTTFLSGLSYYRLSTERRRQLLIVLGVSLGIHLVALIAFGSWVVIRSLQEEKTVFVAPPPMKSYQPRKMEHRVKVQQRQRSSSRPTVRPRMVAMKPSQFSLPEITTPPKAITTSFQPNFKAISGQGLGQGLGTGFGLGGFGTGVSSFDFFGIRGRGDKISVLVDVSESMIEKERGGEKGFRSVKDRIYKVIDALNDQALFNVVAFADAADTFQPKLVISDKANKQKAKAYLEPFNKNDNYGLRSGNVRASSLGRQASGGTTRLDLGLTAAFEQGADTILIISDGLPRVQKVLNAEEQRSWNDRQEQWHRENAGNLRRYEQEMADYEAKTANMKFVEKRVWVGPRERKEGRAAQKGKWVVKRVPARKTRLKRPSRPVLKMPDELKWWTVEDFIEHFELLNEAIYKKKGIKPPTVHAIGYAIDKEGGDFLKTFVRHYNGRYRRIGR